MYYTVTCAYLNSIYPRTTSLQLSMSQYEYPLPSLALDHTLEGFQCLPTFVLWPQVGNSLKPIGFSAARNYNTKSRKQFLGALSGLLVEHTVFQWTLVTLLWMNWLLRGEYVSLLAFQG